MSILLFTEYQQGRIKKGSAELCSYGFALAQQQNSSLTIVTINCENTDKLTQYGASKLINLNVNVDYFEAHAYASALAEIAMAEQAKIIVISSSADAKYMGCFGWQTASWLYHECRGIAKYQRAINSKARCV